MCAMKVRELLCIVLTLTTFTARAELPEAVSAALKKEGIAPETVSIYVQALADSPANLSPPLLSHRAQQPLNPASTMKLLTSYAALELLGPAYRWKTEVYYDGTLKNEVLDGNLYLKGYGDPHLMAADIWRLVNSITQAGVRHIKGDLIIDSSYFSGKSVNVSSFDGDGIRAYNAVPSAMMTNLKAVSFRFASDASKVTITPDPDLPELHVNNLLKVGKADCANWRSRLSYDVTDKTDRAGNAEVRFSGIFAPNCAEKYMELSVLNESDLTFYLFRQLLSAQGGSITGSATNAVVPEHVLNDGAAKLLQFNSETLADLLSDINKWSNNLMARQLLLTIAAQNPGAPGTEEKGVAAIKAWLAGKSMVFDELVIENGSGLSRTERISAQHMGELLTDAFYSPVMPELMSSLPVLAVDGTMQKRMLTSQAQGRAHLKTGTLDGVFAVSGYVLSKSGQRYVMVFMMNGAKSVQTKLAQDALIDWVYQQN